MITTTYASFNDFSEAEKAIGALMDYGVLPRDISLVAHESHGQTEKSSKTEHEGKSGISTTSGADAEAGAAKGAGIGLGVGVLAALSSVFLPGIGLILGGGALATALAGAAGATAAGAVAGGAFGYLKDQGIPDQVVERYNRTITSGGAVLAVTSSDRLGETGIREVLSKYHAIEVNSPGSYLS